MKKLILLFFLASHLHALNILHISCHRGCINEFKRVANELDIQLTSWYVLDPTVFAKFSNNQRPTYDILNMTQSKADYIWHKNKNEFAQFDAIITSDTAPLSRIFLRDAYSKPLIIWVCNRFDYHHELSAKNFPDDQYYQLMREAPLKPNVFVASYTPYEYIYARTKQVHLPDLVIKPIGSKPGTVSQSTFPSNMDKSHFIFISQTGPAPLAPEQQGTLAYIEKECTSRGIRVCKGRYNGPDDLIGIKGVLHFPYQASNLFLFENIQRGIIHFVPSEKFLAMAKQSDNPHMPCKKTKYWLDSFESSEWYLPENKNLFVYFDSFDDLAYKINQLNFNQKQKDILEIGHAHRATMLHRWKRLFLQIESLGTL